MPPAVRRSLLAGFLLACPALRPLCGQTAVQTAVQTAAPTPAPARPMPAAFPSGATTPLGAQIAALLAEPGAARAHWGLAVTALDGTPLFGLDEGRLFRPASNTKLYTTAAALALLGLESRVETGVRAASLEDGVVRGDLVLDGAGDANLAAHDLPPLPEDPATPWLEEQPEPATPLQALDALAAQVARRVTRVTGDVVGDDTLWAAEPHPDSWALEDVLWGYGAPVSALSVHDNQLQMVVRGGASAGAAATVRLTPEVGYYTVVSELATVAAGQSSSFQVERAPGSRTLRLFGTVAAGETHTSQIAIEDPAAFAAMALRRLLIAHGVQVEGGSRAAHRAPTDAVGFTRQTQAPLPGLSGGAVPAAAAESAYPVLLAKLPSPSLADDVKVTLKESQNMHAETLLRRLGARYALEGSSAQGVRVLRQWLLNVGLDGSDFVFYDGSGLSAHDLVTPRATAQLLLYAQAQPWFAAWKASLPLGGVDGTLEHRFSQPPLLRHVLAKTGTLGESRALAGYLDCASGRQVIFVVMVDNHLPSGSDRATMDKIVAAIAAAE